MPRPALRYREHAPPGPLARTVECFWTAAGPGEPGASGRILPDGCSDVIFALDGVTTVGGSGRPGAWAVGTMSRAIRVAHAGRVDLLGVRFRPGGARPSIAVPAGELRDDWVDLADLWGDAAAELRERLAGAPDTRERVALLADALVARLRRGAGDVDGLVLRAAELLSGGPITAASPPTRPAVADVADRLGVSRRHLERRFRDDVGLAPGELRRVVRLRRAADLITAGDLSLGEVAIRAGYHDQSHLGRDFGEMVGTTPGAYRREVTHP